VKDNILEVAMLGAVGFTLVGWVWSMLVARKVHVGWFAGMAFMFIITLPLFAIYHWDKAKKPFLVSLVGFILTYASVYFLPEK